MQRRQFNSNRFINTLHDNYWECLGFRTHPMQGTCIVLRPQHLPLRCSLPLPHTSPPRSRSRSLRASSVFVVFVRFLLLLARRPGVTAVACARITARIASRRTTALPSARLRRSLRLTASCSRRRIILRVLCVLAGRHTLAVTAGCRCSSCGCSRRRSGIGLLLAGIGTSLAGIGRVVLATRCSILWLKYWIL